MSNGWPINGPRHGQTVIASGALLIAIGTLLLLLFVRIWLRNAKPNRMAGPLVSDEEIEKAAREHCIRSGFDPDELVLDYGGPISNRTVETWRLVARQLSSLRVPNESDEV